MEYRRGRISQEYRRWGKSGWLVRFKAKLRGWSGHPGMPFDFLGKQRSASRESSPGIGGRAESGGPARIVAPSLNRWSMRRDTGSTGRKDATKDVRSDFA